jgi:hypothetical protein
LLTPFTITIAEEPAMVSPPVYRVGRAEPRAMVAGLPGRTTVSAVVGPMGTGLVHQIFHEPLET